MKNVFISHIHEDDHRLEPLKELLSKNGCEVRDSSVNSANPNQASDPTYIMNGILKPRIDWSGAVVVLITPDTKDSDWVRKEIEYANEKGKLIVGVWDHGEAGCDLPEALEKFGDYVVGWNSEQIIEALYDRLDGWRNPDGTPVEPRDIPHHRC